MEKTIAGFIEVLLICRVCVGSLVICSFLLTLSDMPLSSKYFWLRFAFIYCSLGAMIVMMLLKSGHLQSYLIARLSDFASLLLSSELSVSGWLHIILLLLKLLLFPI